MKSLGTLKTSKALEIVGNVKSFGGVGEALEIVDESLEDKSFKKNDDSSQESIESSLTCPNCNKIFKKKKYLQQHLKRYGCKKKSKETINNMQITKNIDDSVNLLEVKGITTWQLKWENK